MATPSESTPVLAVGVPRRRTPVVLRCRGGGGGDPASGGGGVDQRRERREVGRQGSTTTGAVDHLGEEILQRLLGLHDLGFEQVDHLLLAVVLGLFQTGDDDRGVQLAPRVLRCGDAGDGVDLDLLPGAVRVGFTRSEQEGLDDRDATVSRADTALRHQVFEERSATEDVVRQGLPVVVHRRREDGVPRCGSVRSECHGQPFKGLSRSASVRLFEGGFDGFTDGHTSARVNPIGETVPRSTPVADRLAGLRLGRRPPRRLGLLTRLLGAGCLDSGVDSIELHGLVDQSGGRRFPDSSGTPSRPLLGDPHRSGCTGSSTRRRLDRACRQRPVATAVPPAPPEPAVRWRSLAPTGRRTRLRLRPSPAALGQP